MPWVRSNFRFYVTRTYAGISKVERNAYGIQKYCGLENGQVAGR